jgi:hypothetical protein
LKANEAACGRTMRGSSVKSGRRGLSQKTSAPFALEDWTKCSGRSLRSGMMRNGIVSPLPTLAPLTAGTASGLLPTPTAQSYGSNKGGAAGRVGKTRYSLQYMASHNLWPTPRASDGAKNVRSVEGAAKEVARKGLSGVDLCSAVRLWPTPSARDWKDTPGMTALRNGKPRVDQLPRAVFAAEHTPSGGGHLNPTWVEWLMGFPAGWTALDASETPSSPRYRTKSSKQSTK